MGSNLGIHLSAELRAQDVSQLQFAGKIGVRQSTINAVINQGARPQPGTLKAIVRYPWKEQCAGVTLLIEHLHDEIHRANLSTVHPETKISISTNTTRRPSLDKTLNGIHAYAEADERVECFLADLLALLDGGAEREGITYPIVASDKSRRAAEEKDEYKTKRKNSKG